MTLINFRRWLLVLRAAYHRSLPFTGSGLLFGFLPGFFATWRICHPTFVCASTHSLPPFGLATMGTHGHMNHGSVYICARIGRAFDWFSKLDDHHHGCPFFSCACFFFVPNLSSRCCHWLNGFFLFFPCPPHSQDNFTLSTEAMPLEELLSVLGSHAFVRRHVLVPDFAVVSLLHWQDSLVGLISLS